MAVSPAIVISRRSSSRVKHSKSRSPVELILHNRPNVESLPKPYRSSITVTMVSPLCYHSLCSRCDLDGRYSHRFFIPRRYYDSSGGFCCRASKMFLACPNAMVAVAIAVNELASSSQIERTRAARDNNVEITIQRDTNQRLIPCPIC